MTNPGALAEDLHLALSTVTDSVCRTQQVTIPRTQLVTCPYLAGAFDFQSPGRKMHSLSSPPTDIQHLTLALASNRKVPVTCSVCTCLLSVEEKSYTIETRTVSSLVGLAPYWFFLEHKYGGGEMAGTEITK